MGYDPKWGREGGIRPEVGGEGREEEGGGISPEAEGGWWSRVGPKVASGGGMGSDLKWWWGRRSRVGPELGRREGVGSDLKQGGGGWDQSQSGGVGVYVVITEVGGRGVGADPKPQGGGGQGRPEGGEEGGAGSDPNQEGKVRQVQT